MLCATALEASQRALVSRGTALWFEAVITAVLILTASSVAVCAYTVVQPIYSV
jgi:hypothetical protein